MSMYDDLDNEGTSEDNSKKGQAEAALLQLIQNYPDAAKYLGPGVLPYLQSLQKTVVDPKTLAALNGTIMALQTKPTSSNSLGVSQ